MKKKEIVVEKATSYWVKVGMMVLIWLGFVIGAGVILFMANKGKDKMATMTGGGSDMKIQKLENEKIERVGEALREREGKIVRIFSGKNPF